MNTGEGAPWYAFVNEGWFGVLVGAGVAAISIVVSIILSRRGRQVASLRRLQFSFPLIGPSRTTDGLEISFEGRKVLRATKAVLALWNDGTTTIHGGDIVERDPLRLELQDEEGEVLRAEITAVSRDVCGPQATQLNAKGVLIGFDFLDPGDAFNVNVLHSGKPGQLQLNGTIRGLPAGLKKFDPDQGWAVRDFLIPLCFLGLILLAASIPAFLALRAFDETHSQVGPYLGFGLAIVIGVVGLHMFATRLLRHDPEGRVRGVPAAVTADPNLAIWTGRRGEAEDEEDDEPMLG